MIDGKHWIYLIVDLRLKDMKKDRIIVGKYGLPN